MNKNWTTLQAFKAMEKFLDGYYQRTSSDDVGSLLGDMQLVDDETITMDSTAWQDLLDAIKELLKEENNKKVT